MRDCFKELKKYGLVFKIILTYLFYPKFYLQCLHTLRKPYLISKMIQFYKKLDPFWKNNYRLVSFLSYVLKIYERIQEINNYMDDKYSNSLTGY